MHELLISALLLIPLFLVGWWYQQRTRNAGWADVIWAFATGVLGMTYTLLGDGEPGLRTIIALIYGLWFTRLGWHLFTRVKGSEEEGRYAYMREQFPEKEGPVFLAFFMMQASWVWLFALPAWVVSQGEMPPVVLVVLALLIVVVAAGGEALADHQLAQFKQESGNQGKTCRKGLWRYSRHPNYFFEWLHWFAYPLLGWNSPHGMWLWLAPAVVFIFLYYVTGIPYTEKQAIRSRGEDYRRYQRNTSAFIPWRPKNETD